MDHHPRLTLMTMISRFLFGPFRPGIEAQRPLLYRIAYAWCHEAALKAWMVSIMNHCWLDHLRSRRDFDDVEDWQDELESGAESPEACCNREQVVACVRAAVARLPMGQRQVLTLVDLEEFGYAEVARILDIPVGTVMSRLSRARAALKNLLDAATPQPAAQPLVRRVK